MKNLFLCLFFLISLRINAQISGQSVQGSGDGKEFVPVGSKEQTGEVDLFSGTYGERQTLGTVSTPTGLSFTLNLSYSSTIITGQNLPFVDGIPYGEGWNLNLPFITINTAAIVKYSTEQQKDYQSSSPPTNPDDTRFSEYELTNTYGDLTWFSPYLNIPGVANGKLIFKYMREVKGKIGDGVPVFVLENFENYIEACFNGYAWEVTLPDGTVYSFNEILYSISSPTNQRVSKTESGNEVLADNSAVVRNLTEPNKSASYWYISKITNPSKHVGYYLSFEYKQYGAFNFHRNNQFLGAGLNSVKFLEAPRELFLKKILAVHDVESILVINADQSNAIITEYLELNYEEDESLRKDNMAYPTKADCSTYDDLYMKEVVYKKGNIGGSEQINFNDWKRFRSPMQIAQEESPSSTVTMDKNNPYLYTVGATNYVRQDINGVNNIAFDHSFLESEKLNQAETFMPGGEVYEVEATVTSSSNKFCLFDINITSLRYTEESINSSTRFTGYEEMTVGNYNATRDNVIFSTFRQAEKYKVGLSSSQSSTVFNQFFNMPALPGSLSNFVVQIGPANSDNDFSITPQNIALNSSDLNYRVASTYFNNPVFLGSGGDDYRRKTAMNCPSNFGCGYPWYMLYQHYKTNLYPQTFPASSFVNERFVQGLNTWWGEPNSHSWGSSAPLRHLAEATLSKDMLLEKFAINRYSKRPYVLKSVKHYVLNGTANTGHTAQTGEKFHKTSELKFNYDVMEVPVYASTIANTSSFTSASIYDRYVIVLKEVINNTDNAAPDAEKLKIKYSYTEVQTSLTSEELTAVTGYYTYEQGGDVVLLSQIETASGSKKEIVYYDWDIKGRINQLTKYQNYDIWAMLAARNGLSGVFSGPSNTYEMAYIVKEVKEKVGNNFNQVIKYDFSTPINHTTSLPNSLYVKDQSGNNVTYYCEHLGQTTKVFSGYEYAYVDYGNSTGNPSGVSNKIKYTFTGSDRLWGKLLTSLTYTELGSTITNLKKTEYTYEVNKAFENGFVRWKRLGSISVGSPPISKTPKNANVALEYDYSDYNSSFLSSTLYDATKYYTVNSPASNTPALLNISVTDTDWDLWKGRLDKTLNMDIGIHIWGVANISRRNYFRDYPYDYTDNAGAYASYFIKLTRIKTTDYELDLSLDEITSVTIKDFKYYDADYKGLSTCEGFAYIKDDFTNSQFNLMYEPSWQLYSIKDYAEDVPTEYTLKENFYYYDLVQKYNVANTDILGTTKFYTSAILHNSANFSSPYFISQRIRGSLPDNNLLSNTQTYGIENFMNYGLEAMCNSQYFGVRNLLMEERVSTSSKDGNEYDDHYKSNYYLYKKSDKVYDNATFDKTTSFITSSDNQYTPSTTPPRFKNLPAAGTADKYWHKWITSLIPKPIVRVDDPIDGSSIDKAIGIYLYTGGYNKIPNIQNEVYGNEALIKHCFSGNQAPYIDNSGDLFKAALQNVKTELNDMYNVDNVPEIDQDNIFDINSDGSVYTEFHQFTLEDFIPMAIKPNITVSDKEFYRLMNLEFEAVKALMCYAIQDTVATTTIIINSYTDSAASEIAYAITTQRNVLDIEREKELYIYVGGYQNTNGCYFPPRFLFQIDMGPASYHIEPYKVFTQIDDGIAMEFQNEFTQLCSDHGYTVLTPPNRTKRPILHFKVKETTNWQCNGIPNPAININDRVEPVFPYAVLKVNEVTDINKFGNVAETKDELDLQSKYIYSSANTRYRLYNGNVLVGVVFDAKHIGLPNQFATIGDNQTYTETFTYDNLNRLTITEDANGLESEVVYDGFGNITEQKVNGTTREKSAFSFWNFRNTATDYVNTPDDPSGSSDYITKYNYTESLIYTTSDKGVINRTYYEPTGRAYQSVMQDVTSISSTNYANIVNYSGLVYYDKWGRTLNTYKPYSATFSGSNLHVDPDFSYVTTNDLKTSLDYTDNLKSRTIETAPYGRSLSSNYTNRNEYYMLDGNDLLTELGLTNGTDNTKIKLLMLMIDPTPDYSDFKFYKTVGYDADNKKTVVYSNIWSQIAATVTFPTSNTKSITVNGYNSQGKLKQTISPNGIQSYYKYNWHGNLIEKTSADAGTARYMYDQAGNVVLEQTEKMREGQEHATAYYRGYVYDKRGRLTKQYVANQKFNKDANFNYIYGLSPTLGPELKKNLPLTTDNANATYTNFVFTYDHDKYENLNTYAWIYKKEYTYLSTNYTLDIDDCLDDIKYEREWYYDAFPTAYQSYFHASISNTTTHVLKYQQNNLPGSLALDVSYNSDYLTSVCGGCNQVNKLVYMRFYSYDIEGKPEWEIQQFNENGIATNNALGEVAKIDYANYLYNGTLETRNVYLLNGAGSLVFKKQYHNTYDDKGRLSSLYLNNASTDLQNGRKIATLDYDATLGMNKAIKYYRQVCNTTLEVDKVEYDYLSDPQNRLTKISTTNSGFGFELFYDNNYPASNYITGLTIPAGNAYYNGNINATIAKYPAGITNFGQPYTVYGYTYDGNNRLTEANGLLDASNTNHGDEGYTYDLAGNILTLNRALTNFGTDIFNYEYAAGTNLLDKIKDQNQTVIRDYSYDKDGNTSVRPFSGGRQLNQIVHGRANLPYFIADNTSQPIYYLYSTDNVRIHKEYNGQSEYYLYDMTGEMLSVIDRSNHTPIDWYAGADNPIVREDANGILYNYVYDHLGNTRLVYKTSTTCTPTIVTTFTYTHAYDYFPYGKILRYSHTEQERMLSTGNERDMEAGDIDGLDYRMARMYDGEIGRFLGVDPLTEEFPFLTPYNYCFNNPVLFVDPLGMEANWPPSTFSISMFNGYVHQDEDGTFQYNLESDSWGAIFSNGDYGAFAYGPNFSTKFYRPSPNITVDKPVINVPKKVATTSGNFQTTLDVIGMTEVPFVSQGAELWSAGISFYDGDFTGGMIGLGSMIPLGGKYFEGLKIARKVAKRLDGAGSAKTLKHTYGELVDKATKKHGGNVTVQRNGIDLFRVHQLNSGHGFKLTQFKNNVAPNGRVFKNDIDVNVRKTHVKQLERALKGDPNYNIRTRGGR